MSEGPVGILAGGGGLPLEIARGIAARGRAVHIVTIDGEADADVTEFHSTAVNWGQIGRMVGSFRQAGCRDLVIVGRVKRPDLRAIKPDLGLFLSLPRIVRLITAGGDDGVLRRVVRFFESKGFRVVGPAEAAPAIVVREGSVGRVTLGRSETADSEIGLAVVAALGGFDMGQAVVVRHGRILALEGAEGTDGMLRRIAVRQVGDANHGPALRAGVLVKRPKPGQELRIDMPTIGPDTVRLAAAAGLAAIAVAADNVLIAEREAVRAVADAAGLAVAGVRHSAEPSATRPGPRQDLTLISGPRIGRSERDDAQRGAGVLAALAPFCRSLGAIVVRRHVLGVETGEGLSALIARTAGLRQWGDRGHSRRGVLVLANGAVVQSPHLQQAAAMGLAGIVAIDARLPADALAAEAAGSGMFIALARQPAPRQGT